MATTQDLEKWFSTAVGRGMNPDGAYGYQCKDVIDDLCMALWGNWVNTITPGDAWTIYNKANRAYFDALPANATLKRGDIVCWNQNMGGGFGHIAVVTEPLGTGFRVIEQNGFTNTRPAYIQTYSNRNNVTGILRPKITQSGGNVSQYQTTVEDAKGVFDYWLGDTASGRWNEWVGQPLDVTVKLVSGSAEAQSYAPTRLAKNDRIAALEAENAALKANPGDADSKKYTQLKASVKELLK